MHGPLAHLVEHFHGMEGVAGSNPAWSTPLLKPSQRAFSYLSPTYPLILVQLFKHCQIYLFPVRYIVNPYSFNITKSEMFKEN